MYSTPDAERKRRDTAAIAYLESQQNKAAWRTGLHQGIVLGCVIGLGVGYWFSSL